MVATDETVTVVTITRSVVMILDQLPPGDMGDEQVPLGGAAFEGMVLAAFLVGVSFPDGDLEGVGCLW